MINDLNFNFLFQEEEYLSGFGMDQGPYGGYVEGYNTRSRLMDTQTSQAASASITSELEGDKMVLKIAKPPRDKDSIMSLSWQCCSWIVVIITVEHLINEP